MPERLWGDERAIDGFRGYVTLFLDLLGMSNELMKLEKLTTGELPLELEKELSGPITALALTRDSFEDIFKMLLESEPRTTEKLYSRTRPGYSITIEDPQVSIFTDCIIISIPIDDKHPYILASSMFGFFCACAGVSTIPIIAGVPLRGAISIGWGFKLRRPGDKEGEPTGEVLGAGNVKAHGLEAKAAIYPRIIVDHNVVEQMDAMIYGKEYHEEEKAQAARLWNLAKELVAVDKDCWSFIDFLSPAAFKLMKRHPQHRRVSIRENISQIEGAITEFYEKATKSKRPDRAAKWGWLHTYFETRKHSLYQLMEPEAESSNTDNH